MLETITTALTKARRRSVSAVAVVALAIGPIFLWGCEGQHETDASAVEAIERIAEELPFFAAYDFAWGRAASDCYDEDLVALSDRCMTELLSLDVSVEALIDLLKHDEPKVRTLAIALLCQREDPSLLPHIAELLDDDAQTYRTIWPAFDHPNPETVWGGQTVAGVARAVMTIYLDRAPKAKLPRGQSSEREVFAAYWDAHKDLPYCASWFFVKLQRAHGGGVVPPRGPAWITYPDTGRIRPDFDSPEDRQRFQREWEEPVNRFRRQRAEAIARVRREIDAIPNDDRIWTLLWLHGEHGGKQLVGEAELVELCKELGPEKLLLMLRNEIPSDDPDLQPREVNRGVYHRMSLFVLYRAEQFFEPSDAQALLACEQWQRDVAAPLGTAFITPWWAIAAVRLQPNDADVVQAAFDRLENTCYTHTDLPVALWELAEESRLPLFVEWFYRQKPEVGAHGPRTNFIRHITSDDTPLVRQMYASIVRDPRSDQIDWETLEEMILTVNRWTQEPVVPSDEVEGLRTPYGKNRTEMYPDVAARWAPERTAEAFQTLPLWRERLRESVPEWAPPAGE